MSVWTKSSISRGLIVVFFLSSICIIPLWKSVKKFYDAHHALDPLKQEIYKRKVHKALIVEYTKKHPKDTKSFTWTDPIKNLSSWSQNIKTELKLLEMTTKTGKMTPIGKEGLYKISFSIEALSDTDRPFYTLIQKFYELPGCIIVRYFHLWRERDPILKTRMAVRASLRIDWFGSMLPLLKG